MKNARRLLLTVFLVLLLGSPVWGFQKALSVRAEDEQPDEPERLITLTVDYIVYKWWLIRYSDNQAVCTVLTEQEGLPSLADINYHCGTTISREWEKSVPCAYTGEELYKCSGYYLHGAGSSAEQRQVEIELPLPQVYISLEGCQPEAPQNACDATPVLVFTGEEPLPNEQIIRLQGIIGEDEFSCPGSQCRIPLPPTGDEGVAFEFWGDSSYGDSSQHFTGKLRVIPWGNFMSPDEASTDQPLWYVDVLSSQWRGPRPASCSDVWQVFPDIAGPSPWLTSPTESTQLASSLSYYYLAGMLIRQGVVDASECADYGMQDENIASECGVEKAQAEMLVWQNYFDEEILRVSDETGVPAQLLKNVFSRESQFWPGIYQNFEEAGLGQLTEKGADAVLLWNTSFYDQFCPLVIRADICALGFGNLDEAYQNMLRGALVSTVNATCLDCQMGIDLSQANFSVNVFAETLLANCVQVEQIFYNTTTKPAGAFSSYEDLWRFTLVNYNAGPGCLADAIEQTLSHQQELNWKNVNTNLSEGCRGAIDYVESISQAPQPEVEPTPWVESTTVVQPEYDPLPTPTATPPPPVDSY